MKKYLSYKSSGVEWIGDIPEHWVFVSTNKIFDNLGSGTTPKSENIEYYEDGIYNWITTSDLNENVIFNTINKLTNKTIIDYPSLTFYPANSIFISMYGAKIGKIGISTFQSYCNQSVCVLPEKQESNMMFYYYWFLCFQEQLKSLGRGGGQPNINKDMIKEFPVCKIALNEQHKIVQFLDEKTEIIDKLLSTKERKIDLLKQQRTSLINQVITKGLDPNVKMKDSGVEWIGEIPALWESSALKYCVNSNEKSLDEITDPNYELNYIEIGDVDSSGNINNSTPYLFKNAPSRCRRILSRGDVFVSTVRTYLKSIGYIQDEVIDLICSTGFCVLTPKETIISKYLFYQILTEYFIGKVISKSEGVSYPSITATELIKIKILVPPFSEQQKIVDHLDIHTKGIDDLISLEQKKIDLLKEYRQSLISEVITGKIDVRTFQN